MRKDGTEGEGTTGHGGEEVPTHSGRRRSQAEIGLSLPGDRGMGWGGPVEGCPGGTLHGEVQRGLPMVGGRGSWGGGRPRTPLTVQGQSGWRDGVRECVRVYGGGHRHSPLPLLQGKTQKHLPQPGWAGGS